MEPTCRDASTPGRPPRRCRQLRSATGALVASRACPGLTAIVLAGLLAVPGCGGDDGPEMPPAGECEPLTNAGCAVAEKCSILVESESPYSTVVTCVPSGNVQVGGLCGFGAPGPRGFDNCQPGGFCLDGMCTPICALGGAGCTGADQACIAHAGVFEDRGLGLCTRLCEPLDAASCAPEQGCYLSLGTGQATCHGAGSLDQGDVCTYIDACAPGLGCVLLDADGQRTLCTALCDPATAVTASGQTCAQVLGMGEPACVAINRFYGDTPDVPDDIGMCVDCADPGYADLTVCSSGSSAR
jgi:hypothetical protein